MTFISLLVRYWRAGLIALLIGLLGFAWVAHSSLEADYSNYKADVKEQQLQREQKTQELKDTIQELNNETDRRLTEQYEQLQKDYDNRLSEYRSGTLRLRSELATANTILSQSTVAGNGQAQCQLSPDFVEHLVREAARADRNTLQLQAAQQVIRNYTETTND